MLSTRTAAVAAVLVLGLIVGTQAGPRAPDSIAAWITDKPGHATILKLLKEYNLLPDLGPDFNGTVFLPTENAFRKLEAVLPDLTKQQILAIMMYHVYSKNVNASDFLQGGVISTLLGNQTLTLGRTPDGKFNSVNKVKINKILTLGRAKLAIIDTLLLPKVLPKPKPDFPTVLDALHNNTQLSNVTNVIRELGLLDAVKDFEGTLFLPVNSAFDILKGANMSWLTEDILREILLYHAVPKRLKTSDWFKPSTQRQFSLRGLELKLHRNGTDLYVEDASVLKRITAGKAVIYLINEIMVPGTPPNAQLDFYEALGLTKQLSTLKGLVDMYPDMVKVLKESDFIGSCFAPVNKAFEGIDTTGLTKAQIRNILEYHCTDEKVLRGYDFAMAGNFTMLNNGTVLLSRVDGANQVNGVRVMGTIPAGLGTIFVIGEVLLPETKPVK